MNMPVHDDYFYPWCIRKDGVIGDPRVEDITDIPL